MGTKEKSTDGRKTRISDRVNVRESDSSSESEESENEKGLLCQDDSDIEDLCLMAKDDDDEVNSYSSSSHSASLELENPMDSFLQMMKDFKELTKEQSILKEVNNRLMSETVTLAERNHELLKVVGQFEQKVLLLEKECTERKIRELKLSKVVERFNKSSQKLDELVDLQIPAGVKSGLGFESIKSQSLLVLTKPTDSSTNGGKSIQFVKSQESKLRSNLDHTCESSTQCIKGKEKVVEHSQGNPKLTKVKPNQRHSQTQWVPRQENVSSGQNPSQAKNLARNNQSQTRVKSKPNSSRTKSTFRNNPSQTPRYNQGQKNVRTFQPRKRVKGEGRLFPSDEDWTREYKPMSKRQFEQFHLHKRAHIGYVNPKKKFTKTSIPRKHNTIHYVYPIYDSGYGYGKPYSKSMGSRQIWVPKGTTNHKGPIKIWVPKSV